MLLKKSILYQPNPDVPLGKRNPKAAPELVLFDFVIGDWDVAITLNQPNGKSFKYSAKWHNYWMKVNDGPD